MNGDDKVDGIEGSTEPEDAGDIMVPLTGRTGVGVSMLIWGCGIEASSEPDAWSMASCSVGNIAGEGI